MCKLREKFSRLSEFIEEANRMVLILLPKKRRSNRLWKKAVKLYAEGRVELQRITENAFYFQIWSGKKRYDVMIAKTKWTKDWCTCMWFSLHPGTECSHILAAKIYLSRERIPNELI